MTEMSIAKGMCIKSNENDALKDENAQCKGETPTVNSGNSRRFMISCPCYVPKRLIQTILLGFGMLLLYAMRTNVGVLVVMILSDNASEKVGTLDARKNLPRVLWDSRMIGFLHSVFYIGFILSQIPGAYLTTIWPSHRIYGTCIVVSALFNLLLPVCIGYDQYVVTCSVRGIQGISEGLLYPSCYGILRHWSARSERSRQVSTVLSCAYVGAILGFPMAGVITHYLRWQYIFYISGFLCIVWYLFWLCLSYEKPSHHVSISQCEFNFMEKSQGQDTIEYENVTVPWRQILTSLPVISICLCHFVRQWLFGFLLTNEPLYLSMFGFNMAETGLYASFPHIAKVILSFASGYIADSLLNSTKLSTTIVRKLLLGIGMIVLSSCLLALTAIDQGTAVVIVLTVAMGGFGLTTSGWAVNHYDLATRYVSSLVAVTATFGTIGAIIVPLVVGDFTVNKDFQGWANVFYLTFSLCILATVFFLIFGSGEQQPWANPPDNICLIQKIDPLARRPYSTFTVQKNAKSDTSLHNKPTQPGLVPPDENTVFDGDKGSCNEVKTEDPTLLNRQQVKISENFPGNDKNLETTSKTDNDIYSSKNETFD